MGENAPQVINVALGQTYDTLEILSLKLRQENLYKLFSSDYGVIVGRVLASGNFGVPNAKVSVFIEAEGNESTFRKILYGYKTVSSKNEDGIRYNLLPDEAINACYQNVGTFPNKRYLLDNTDVIETFDKYWKYTTVTNAAGDYMLFGIPTGQQTVHVDIDLSDIGVLSQRPRDMMYQGFNINQFESPNKFKQSTDLTSLAQIKSQDKGVNVFPYWGDTTMDDGATIGITRCDIQIQYEFQPTCIFMGSIITDKASNAIGKNCGGSEKVGNMSELGTGEGSIEMIRKTVDGKTEEFQIKGNRLIDGDGVWCYQIPMNLDYVMTDEFGNTVPTDDPTKGIPTRTRVRFRISLDETPEDRPAKKRARYLVPNNPRIGPDYPEFTKRVKKMGNDAIDYEFGSATLDEDFRDLMWNNVYTVKNYIPRIQASKKARNKKNTAIKKVNFYGDNNPMPYNNLTIRLGLEYSIICIVIKAFITLVGMLNSVVMGILSFLFDDSWDITIKLPKPLGKVKISLPNPIGIILKFAKVELHCIPLNGRFCETAENTVYFPGCPGNEDGDSFINLIDDTKRWVDRQNYNAYYYACVENGGNGNACAEEAKKLYGKQNLYNKEKRIKLEEGSRASFDEAELFNCVENQLIEQNESASFNFSNDWVNGVLYAPLWFRKIRPKKKFFFGAFTRKAMDKYCSADRDMKYSIKVHQSCAANRKEEDANKYTNEYGEEVKPYTTIPSIDSKNGGCGNDCQKEVSVTERLRHGIIKRKETLYSSDVYYYAPVEFSVSMNKNDLLGDGYPNGDVKLLYATDLVLLGSLNDCDRFGIPQFFKVLEPTTYQLPPALLAQDDETSMIWDSEMEMMVPSEESSASPTDMTGCDWGNSNKYDQYYQIKRQWSGIINFMKVISYDGGLFYGVNCTSVDTVGKTNINLLRLCELGVSLDETEEVEDLGREKQNSGGDVATNVDNLVADGFVSKDELYDLDSRAAFATMNYNNLRTVFDEERGIYVYDFRYLYPENFDGALYEFMKQYMTEFKDGKKKETMEDFTTDSGDTVSYRFNYLLETFNRDYYRFRMGKAPYFYDNGKKYGEYTYHDFPRYENSFYFYFGLKFGKTAIEKFNSQFFSTCENNAATAFDLKYEYRANSWCTDGVVEKMDCYLALDVTDIVTPYSVSIKNKYDDKWGFEITDIKDEKIIIINTQSEYEYQEDADIKDLTDKEYVILNNLNNTDTSMANGIYELVVIDGEGNIVTDTVKFNQANLTYSTENSIDFKRPFNKIMEENNDDYTAIANNIDGGIENRTIGGVICIDQLVNSNDIVNSFSNFKITIESTNKIFESEKWKAEYSGDSFKTTPVNCGKYNIVGNANAIYFTVPKGNEIYNIEVIQMCDGAETTNRNRTTVTIGEPQPLKMYINNVDADLFSGKEDDWKVDGNEIGPAWFDMRNQGYYNWNRDSKYSLAYDKDAYMNGVYDAVEQAFVMTKYGTKTLSIRMEGDETQYPATYYIKGQIEGSVDFDMEDYPTFYYIDKDAEKREESSITFGIPNITTKDNILWHSEDSIESYDNACWAHDNKIDGYSGGEKGTNSKKQPYECSIETAAGEELPKKDSVIKVIIIDKIIKSDIVSWASTIDGLEGFVMGDITNGVASQTEDGKRKFSRQTLGGDDFVISYSNGTNEKSYPIESYIGADEEKYHGLICATLKGKTTQPLIVMDSMGNGINMDIEGNLEIELTNNGTIINASTNSAMGEVTYYLYEYDGDENEHPYQSLLNNDGDITGEWNGSFSSDSVLNLFSRKTTSETLKDRATAQNQVGMFNVDKNQNYIILAENRNKTRALSKIFDITETITGNVELNIKGN